MNLCRRLILCFGLALLSHQLSAFNACDDVISCVELIPEIEEKVYGQGKLDQEIRSKLESFGRLALPALLPLTAEKNANRRRVADSIISNMQDLLPQDFIHVKQVIENNIEFSGSGGWSYGALGYVGGEESGRFLIQELLRIKSHQNQIGTAFRRLGKDGIAFLVEALVSPLNCAGRECLVIKSVFAMYHEEGMKSDEDAHALIKIALDTELPDEVRQTAIGSLGYVSDSDEIAKGLINLAAIFPESLPWVLSSAQNMTSQVTTDFFVKNWEHAIFMRDPFITLSEFGKSAYAAGESIRTYLDNEDWESVLSAAQTLGYIGYRPAIPDLVRKLHNSYDVKLTYVALKSLYLLNAGEEIAEIENVAQTHWYKPIREYAMQVVGSLRSGREYKADKSVRYFAQDFMQFERLGMEVEPCESTSYPQFEEPKARKLYLNSNQDLTEFRYTDPRCEYGSASESYCPQGVNFLIPDVVARHGESWLSGRDQGEWGGELVLFRDKSTPQIVLRENIEDIYVIGGTPYVIAGLGHLGLNNGFIYQVISGRENSVDVVKTHRLPGAPQTSWKISDTEIFINTGNGSVIFDTQNGFKEAKCLD